MTQVIPYVPKYPVHKKSPKAVFLLNAFPGLGNIYAEGMRGCIWLAAACACLYIFPNIMTWVVAFAILTSKGYKAAEKHNRMLSEGKLPDSLKKNAMGLSGDEIKKEAERAERELGAKMTEYSVLVTFIEVLKALQVRMEGATAIFEKKVEEILAEAAKAPSRADAAPEQNPPFDQHAAEPADQAPAPNMIPDHQPRPGFPLPGNVAAVPAQQAQPLSPDCSYPQHSQEPEPVEQMAQPAAHPQPSATPKPAAGGGKFCIECGAPRDPNFSFCISCGAGSVSQT